MFQDMWFVVCFLLPVLPFVMISGTLTFAAWLYAFSRKPFKLQGSIVMLTSSVAFDFISVVNSFSGDKLFPMVAYGGNLDPFFYTWVFGSFALIVTAGVFLIKERAERNRYVTWGTISQLVMHSCALLLKMGYVLVK